MKKDRRTPVEIHLEKLSDGPSHDSSLSVLSTAAALLSKGADARSFAWHRLDIDSYLDLARRLKDSDRKPATIRKTLSTVRSVLRICRLRGSMSQQTYLEIMACKLPPQDEFSGGRPLRGREIAALLAAVTADDYGLRDAAAVVLMAGFGLRRAEAAKVLVQDYDPAKAELEIVGKGGRRRMATCIGRDTGHLDRWLARRGPGNGPIICRVNPIRRAAAIGGQQLAIRVDRLRLRAGLDRFTPHDLRRSFVTRCLAGGMDLAATATAAGHKNVQTTKRYDWRNWTRISSTVQGLSLTRDPD